MRTVRLITYVLKYAAIYFVFFQTMFISGVDKIRVGEAPPWFVNQFSETFIATFPGTNAAYLILGIMEITVAVILIISILTLEWLPRRPKYFLLMGIALSALTFGFLGFGQNLTDNFDGAASLFFYFGATLVAWLVVVRDHDFVLLKRT
jgi:ABC-type Fe3+-siderophore transport system permease subunit